MSLFQAYLDQVENAQSEELRQAAISNAFNEIENVSSDDTWEDYADYGSWVTLIPGLIRQGKREKSRQFLKTLIHLAIRCNEARIYTAKDIILKIKRCKSIEELNELKAGQQHLEYESSDGVKTVVHVGMSLHARIEHIAKRLELEEVWPMRIALAEQEKYLKAKHLADKVAWPLTILLCIFGVGLVCGIAMFAAFPAIGIVGFLALSAIIGYVEIPVYYSFIKHSLRNIFARGLFQTIDNHLLKQIAEERNLKDRHELEDKDKQSILDDYAPLRYLKRTLTSIGGLVSLIAALGFSALAYMQVVEALALIGIVGTAATVLPWLIVPFAFIYFYVIADNIHSAIKNNIFTEIGKQLAKLKLFNMEDCQTSMDRFIVVAKSLGKIFGLMLVLGIAVFATVFSAGAWLKGSGEFFAKALNIVESTADIIGYVVGAIQLVTTFSFNMENILKTIGRLRKMAKSIKKGVADYVNESIDLVKAEPYIPFKIGIAIWRVLRPLVKYLPLAIHIIGVGMLSSQGADSKILQPPPNLEEPVKAGAATTQAVCELLEDGHTVMPHAHHDHGKDELQEFGIGKQPKKHDKHEHADPAADVEWLAGKIRSGILNMITFFKHCRDPEPPFAIISHDIKIDIEP